jgi:hypothetical protein
VAIKTSVGDFFRDEFIKNCNDRSFPEGLRILGWLYLDRCTSLTALPAGLHVRGDLDLLRCTSLTALPEGLKVGGYLNLRECTSLTSLPDGLQVDARLDLEGCTSLTALPNGLQVGGFIFVDPSFIERYPFKGLPKILHLPFLGDIKKLIIERLQSGY